MDFVFSNRENFDFIFEKTIIENRYSCLIWDLMPEVLANKLMKVASEQYNIAHGVTIEKHFKDYSEYYYFATDIKNSHINHFYINNKEDLNNFILYFKDKAADILKGPHAYIKSEKTNLTKFQPTSHKDIVSKSYKIQRFYLENNYYNAYLTKREAETLTLYTDDYTVKEIAKHLSLSNRTIEEYLSNIKAKLDSKHKSTLINTAKNNGFNDIYNFIKNNNQTNLR